MAFVEIDQDACIECGLCYSICEEVFESDEDGKSQLVEKYRKGSPNQGEVPDSIKCIREAEESCPVDAITVK